MMPTAFGVFHGGARHEFKSTLFPNHPMFVPKTVLRALDELEVELGRVEASAEEIKVDPMQLSLTITGLMALLKKTRGEDVTEALEEYNKGVRAADRLVAKPPTPASVEAKRRRH
ncbi:hypothetical protein BASA81_010154 [Batrachochytrium salamandrivorans]|nr:hypothetical protein BASA81_010154 [Batrachochytrium salamandrivorans]